MKPGTRFKRRARTSPTLLRFLALLLIAGCRDASVVTTPREKPQTVPATPTAPTTPLSIWGEMTEQYQSFSVMRGGAEVRDAVVTVNAFPIPHYSGGHYSGSFLKQFPPEARST